MAKNEQEDSLGFTYEYDVFLSFRGDDTRNRFVGYLRNELSQKGINTFYDDRDLRMGEAIAPSLSNAIEESKILMVVFSENYASSTWCLDELVKILECTKITRDRKQLFFPIFYHVDPSDMRHQRRTYGDHMIAHENKFGKDSQKVQAWRSALFEACNLPGHHIISTGSGYEINLIKEIVEKVYKNIDPKPLHIGQNPVGLEPRIEEVMSLLEMKPGDKTVSMLGIYGLGGIGKTELAKALYDKIVQHFDAASFLADIREKSNKINGLEDLQKTLLSEMREELQTELGSASKGMSEIKRKLYRKKVLLVLDDVDDQDRLIKLAGGRDWFGSGSRIIITTRDKDVLIAHQVENIYEMKELDKQHSLELFCWNAFQQSHPKTGFKDVSLRAVYVAKGLPLALKVIGSDLAPEESLDDWESVLKDYERNCPNEKILDVLKISYNRLDNTPKQVFLDIACFFKGEKKEYVENILEEFRAKSNIKVLVNKSLLTIEDGCLKMHDLIQGMGREIVRQEAPNPGDCSRVWYHDDVIDILTDDLGSEKIQGILLDPPQREKVDWSGTAFEKMKRLRILIVRNTSFSSEPKHLPNHLRVLDWEEYPSQSFPSKFHPKKIIVFNLRESHLTLEEPFKEFSRLTYMDFSNNQSITKMPDVSLVQNLRELRVDNCRNLVAVHESVGRLKRLAHLSASECTQLTNFLQKMFLPCLEVLDLNLCLNLEHFPEIMGEMKNPLKIYMINTDIQELPESVGNLTGLVSIEISCSRKLKYLPSSLFTLPNVVAFKLGGCFQLQKSFKSSLQSASATNVCPTLRTMYFGSGGLSDEDLLAILNCFLKLEELIASDNNFVSLPACIKECVHLTSLDLSLCNNLKKIPKCTNLKILNVNRCGYLEEISELPSTIQKVDARHCSSLTRETSDMLWFQAKKEIRGLEVVMPAGEKQVVMPKWFDCVGNEGNPHFCVRGKFPIFALALVFQVSTTWPALETDKLVELHLLINGRCVPRKGHYNFRIAADHILICDPRLLFSDKEWLGLDAFLDRDWNQVQVSYVAASNVTLSCWGLNVYQNKKHVQFECPDPTYTDKSPAKDPTLERKRMIEILLADQWFDMISIALSEVDENIQDCPQYSDIYLKENLSTVFGTYRELSRQAKAELESQGSDLQDKHSLLTSYLQFYESDEALQVGKAITSDPMGRSKEEQLQHMKKIIYDGMTDGLVEARNNFPSLNIIKTRGAVLNKGPNASRIRWIFVVLPEEKQLYIEGIISGLLEAKLSFPDLDVWATLDCVFCRRGMQVLDERIRLLVRVMDEVKTPVDVGETSTSAHQEQGYDPQQQKVTWEMFYYGIMDGLVQAHKSFPSLDFVKTTSAALNKGNRVVECMWSTKMLLPTDEMRTYTNGIINGLHEAKLSFPDLDMWATLDAVLSRMGIYETPMLEFASSIIDAVNIMQVGEASTSGHQGSEEDHEKIMRKIYEGVTDGLVEARNRFPSLDIIKTRGAALNKGSKGSRVEWIFIPPQVETKLHIEGIINGLLEATLSFPDLDVWATLDGVLCRRGMEGLSERIHPLIRVMDEVKDPMAKNVGRGSTSGYHGSEEERGYYAQQQKLMKEIFYDGITDALVEAQNSFPSLDIVKIRSAVFSAIEKGNWIELLPDRILATDEMRIYMTGIINGLHEAKLSFPDVDKWATLNAVLSKIGIDETLILHYTPRILIHYKAT